MNLNYLSYLCFWENFGAAFNIFGRNPSLGQIDVTLVLVNSEIKFKSILASQIQPQLFSLLSTLKSDSTKLKWYRYEHRFFLLTKKVFDLSVLINHLKNCKSQTLTVESENIFLVWIYRQWKCHFWSSVCLKTIPVFKLTSMLFHVCSTIIYQYIKRNLTV